MEKEQLNIRTAKYTTAILKVSGGMEKVTCSLTMVVNMKANSAKANSPDTVFILQLLDKRLLATGFMVIMSEPMNRFSKTS